MSDNFLWGGHINQAKKKNPKEDYDLIEKNFLLLKNC